MSLLTICQTAAVSVGLPMPNAVVGAQDPNTPRLLALLQQEGDELARRHDWQALVTEHTWTTDGNEAQAAALPADYDRMVVIPSIWNRSLNYRVQGPVTQEEWQWMRKWLFVASLTGYWRLIGGVVHILPSPVAGQTMSLEYVSKNWVQGATGPAAAWAADTDTARIPERLLTLGLIWRWKRSVGLDYAEENATYEREVDRACSRDRGVKVVSPDRRKYDSPSFLVAVPNATILTDGGDNISQE